MKQQNYEVDILVNGHSIKEYYKNNKVYVEGRRGIRFSLKIKNNGYKKILAIPTIDGLSVMNGKEANYNSPGYIIDGYDSIIIDGWRTSDKEVAEFYFSDPKDSYSHRTKKQNNLGIIGVVIFREEERINCHEFKERPYYYLEHPLTPWPEPPLIPYVPTTIQRNAQYNCNTANVSSVTLSAQDLGTGFGKYKRSEVITVDFEKEKWPDSIFEIYYNTKHQLKKLGIDFYSKPEYISPQAFPNQFCKPPKN